MDYTPSDDPIDGAAVVRLIQAAKTAMEYGQAPDPRSKFVSLLISMNARAIWEKNPTMLRIGMTASAFIDAGTLFFICRAGRLDLARACESKQAYIDIGAPKFGSIYYYELPIIAAALSCNVSLVQYIIRKYNVPVGGAIAVASVLRTKVSTTVIDILSKNLIYPDTAWREFPCPTAIIMAELRKYAMAIQKRYHLANIEYNLACTLYMP